MIRAASKLCVMFGLAMALLPPSGAMAAPEESNAENQQTQLDDRTYLPPWMQKQAVAGTEGGVEAFNPGPTGDAINKQKVPGSTPGTRVHRRPRNNFWRNFGILWR
jgi:hypothetical protein